KEDLDVLAQERRRATIITPLPGGPAFPISINGAFRGGVQWIVNPARAKDDVFGFSAGDVVVTARPTPDVTFLVDLEGLVGPGAGIRVSQGDWRDASGVHAPADVDGDMTGLPYIIGELGRRKIFALAGHYRWWARVGSVPDRPDDVTWGTGVSVDQLVSENTG